MNVISKTAVFMAFIMIMAGCVMVSDDSDAASGSELTSENISSHMDEIQSQYRLSGSYFLNSNITVSAPLVFTGTSSIDLNGFTLVSSYQDVLVVANGSLIIDDTSSTKTGKVSNTNDVADVTSRAVFNQSILVINGGVFEADRAVVNSSNASYSPSTTINGGTFNADTSVRADNGSMTINNGTFNGISFGALVSGTGTMTINQGTFVANAAVQVQIGGKLTIDGGEFKGTTFAVAIITQPGYGTVSTEINGGSFTSEDTGIVIQGGGSNSDGATLIVNEGVIEAKNGFAISGNGTWDYADIVINGGTIASVNGPGVYFPQIGNLTITDGIITGTTGVQFAGAGVVTISGGTLRGTSESLESPLKPATQGDGSFDDGAAFSIVSRGNGWQDPNAEINTVEVVITGGNFISDNNSPLASYRAQQPGKDEDYVFNEDVSGIDSCIDSFNIEGGNFLGDPSRPVIEYDHSSESVGKYVISGGTFTGLIEQSFVDPQTPMQTNPDGSVSFGDSIVTETPDQPLYPWWDDDDEYVPPIVPVQPEDSDDDTTTIVACAAAAVVAALIAVYLIIDRKH